MTAKYSKEPESATSADQLLNRANRAGRGAERGAALVLALLVVALLMTLIMEFDRSVRLEHRAAGNYRDGTAAFYLAKAGLAEGQALLMEDGLAGGASDDLSEAWASPVESRLGGGAVRVSIIDEERFFPINSLIMQNTPDATRVAQFQRLLRLLKIDDRLADAVMDWIDENDDVRSNGAENSYYESLPAPYRAHNGPMASVEELRLIRGVTGEIYGRLAPHLTAVQPGSIQINLNTADPQVLQALSDGMTPDLVGRLIAERPIEKEEISTILAGGLTVNERGGVDLVSHYFTIEAEGIVNDIVKVVAMRVERGGLDLKPLWVRTQS